MSAQLPYRLEIENRRAIVVLLPELNEVPWADIERVGSEILTRIQALPSPNLLVDLTPLNYMGSAQVALVVRMFKTIKEKNGKMVVANRDPMVLEVLTLAGLNKVWTIVDSRDRALSMLGGGPSAASGNGASGAASSVVPGLIALVALVAAAVFVAIHVANPALLPSRGDLIGCVAAALVAFIAGLWALAAGNRGTGIGAIVLSVAALLFGVFELAKSTAPLPPDSNPPPVDLGEPSPNLAPDADASKLDATDAKAPNSAPPLDGASSKASANPPEAP
jgi:anti-anti-sigma factor